MKVSTTNSSGARETPFVNDQGLLNFAEGDQDNPKNWSTTRKCIITGIVTTLVINCTFASSAPSGAFDGISRDLHVSVEAAGLVITLYLLGYIAGPLCWAALSEFYGRRWIFLCTFTLYLIFNFLCAFTPNFAGLLVGRFLTGTFVSSVLTNSPGVFADLWGPIARGNAMIIFSTATFIGPALGPVVSGFLELTKNWRWTFYMLLWLAGITEAGVLTLPETLPDMALLHKAKRLRKSDTKYAHILAPVEASDRSLSSIFKRTLTRPWILLFDPISFLIATYYSIVYALLYMLFSIYPIVFQQKRGWNAGVGELPLLGLVVGAFPGTALLWYLNVRDRKKAQAGHVATPEDRLIPAMIGGPLFAGSMFWFGWTAEYNSIHWVVPTLAGAFLAMSILLIFVSFLNYLVDVYTKFAASAMAANTVARSACAAAAPLFTNYMFDALGVGGGSSLIGGVAVVLAPIPFVFWKYGSQIRGRSKFARSLENEVSGQKQQKAGV